MHIIYCSKVFISCYLSLPSLLYPIIIMILFLPTITLYTLSYYSLPIYHILNYLHHNTFYLTTHNHNYINSHHRLFCAQSRKTISCWGARIVLLRHQVSYAEPCVKIKCQVIYVCHQLGVYALPQLCAMCNLLCPVIGKVFTPIANLRHVNLYNMIFEIIGQHVRKYNYS